MKPFATLKEHAVLLPLRLLAALHILFFLAFLASLLAAAGKL